MSKKEIIGEDGKVYEVREKKKKGKGCLVIIGILILFSIISYLFGGNKTKDQQLITQNNSNPSNSEQAQQKEEINKIGDTVTSEGFSITANSKSKSKEITDESGYISTKPTDGSTFYLVNVSISNTSNDPINLSNSSFKLMNGEKSYVSTIDFVSQESLTFDTLNPDQIVTGNLIFEVPDQVIDNPGFVLMLSGSWFSGDLKGDLKISLDGEFSQ